MRKIRITKKGFIVISLIILIALAILIISFLDFWNNSGNKAVENFKKAELKPSNSKIENESLKEDVENNEIIKEEELIVYNSSLELVKLNNNGWKFEINKFEGDYENIGSNYYYKGFTLTRKKNSIRNIIFNEEYGKEVITGIYVGMDFNIVKEKLGNPFFENSDIGMIGYITQNLILCIYEDEIVVYKNKFYYNNDLEEMIVKYYTNEYQGTKNDFSRYIRNNYEDFEFTSDEDKNIYLTSQDRGMIICINDDIKVFLYKNYDNSGSILEKNMPENIEYLSQYAVEEFEVERKMEQ